MAVASRGRTIVVNAPAAAIVEIGRANKYWRAELAHQWHVENGVSARGGEGPSCRPTVKPVAQHARAARSVHVNRNRRGQNGGGAI